MQVGDLVKRKMMHRGGSYPFHPFVDKFIAEPSSDNEEHYIVRALHYVAYEKGEVDTPSTFVCECDFKEAADIIADLLNDMETK